MNGRALRQKSLPKTEGFFSHALNAYVVAATASGVGLLATSIPATARIICKHSEVSLQGTNTYPFNPAGENIPPFNLAQTFSGCSSQTQCFWNRGFFTPNSLGANVLLAERRLPANLLPGATIGPSDAFGKGKSYGLLFTYQQRGSYGQKHHRGNFKLGETGYIGYTFSASGKPHFGWARIHLVVSGYNDNQKTVTTYLLAYGYETVPDKAILAGACSAPDASNREGASLGMLALGAQALPRGRRNEDDLHKQALPASR